MKRKSVIAISTLLIASSLLASCGGGTKKVSFGEYWYKNSSVSDDAKETLSYAVSFTPGAGLGKNYDISYTDGEYVTTFGLVEKDGKQVYELSSTFTIVVSYTFNGKVETHKDSTNSVVYFEKNKALTPISSEQHLVSHSPKKKNESGEISGCYDFFDYSASVVYDGASGVSKITNNDSKNAQPKTHEFEIDDADDYTYIDNEQLYFALRALQPTSTAPTLLVYAPFSKAVQKIEASFGSEVTGEKFSFVKNGEAQESTIAYRPITITLAESNPGAPQIIKVASTNDPDRNTNRNIILEIQTQLAYNLGTLTYKLKSADLFDREL